MQENKGKIKVLFICLGNICRSTMAESVMTYLVAERGLEDKIAVASAATSNEEIGNSPHYGTVRKLQEVGIPLVPHRAVQMTRADYEKYDFLIGMDNANIRNMTYIAGGDSKGKIYKLNSFVAGRGGELELNARDTADPWFTGNFDATYKDVMAGCRGLLEYLEIHGYLS